MIRVTQWAEIRHMHLVDGVPKKEIARRLGVNVKTVRSALKRETPPLKRESPTRGCRLDEHRALIKKWLRGDRRLTAKRIWKLLRPLTGSIGERTVRRYVSEMRSETTHAGPPASAASSSPEAPRARAVHSRP